MKSTVILFLFLLPLLIFGQHDSNKFTDSTKKSTRRMLSCPSLMITIKPIQVNGTYTITSNYENHYERGLPHMYFSFDKKLNEMANTQAGVLSMDGSTPSIKGARADATAYYINGVRIMDIIMPPELL